MAHVIPLGTKETKVKLKWRTENSASSLSVIIKMQLNMSKASMESYHEQEKMQLQVTYSGRGTPGNDGRTLNVDAAVIIIK